MQCGYKTGEDRLYLRLPVEVCHVIDQSERALLPAVPSITVVLPVKSRSPCLPAINRVPMPWQLQHGGAALQGWRCWHPLP